MAETQQETKEFRVEDKDRDHDYETDIIEEYHRGLPDRILAMFEDVKQVPRLQPVTQYDHSLQCATRAYRDGKSEEYVVAALLHDLCTWVALYTHDVVAAAILRPYVSEKMAWIIKYHGLFRMHDFPELNEELRNKRDRFKNHPHFADAVEFCEYDTVSANDTEYESEPIEFFEPMVRRVFSKVPPRWGEDGNYYYDP